MANFLFNLSLHWAATIMDWAAWSPHPQPPGLPCQCAPIEHNKMARQLASKNPCQFYFISFHLVPFPLPCPALSCIHIIIIIAHTCSIYRGSRYISISLFCIVMPPQAFCISISAEGAWLGLWYVPGMESQHLFVALTCTKVPHAPGSPDGFRVQESICISWYCQLTISETKLETSCSY